MIKYYNITKNLDIVLTEDRKLSSKQLEDLFISEIKKSLTTISSFNRISKNQYKCSIKYKNDDFSFITILKNITGAGWENKPKIKRVQVRNGLIVDNINIYKKDLSNLNVIIGVYNYDNNPIIVAWDAYKYYNHKTQRSCYVSTDSLLLGYEKGFYEGVDSSQKIWIFKGEEFNKFIESYIIYIRENGLNE